MPDPFCSRQKQKFIGDAFRFGVAISAPGVTDFSLWAVSGAAQLADNRIVPMTIEWLNHAAGTFAMHADTAAWPAGWVHMNLSFRPNGGEPYSTKPNKFLMAKRIAPAPGVV